MNDFLQLGLSQTVVDTLKQIGFEKPTPVQEQSIPLLLKNDPTDFIGIAQTGTGKTAAFGLPLLELIDATVPTTQALIMAPTRELGQQIALMLRDFSKASKDINIAVVYGGAAISNQIKALKRPTHIVVATPGRLLDLINRKAIHLDAVRYVVLDEADEMLNMGFKEDIDKILSHTLDDRSTWLFSATMPKEIRRIVDRYMDAPYEVAINAKEKVNSDIDHKYVVTTIANKLPAIRRFLDIQPDMRGILFCRTRRETQKIADELSRQGYGVEALHGDLSQRQRDTVMRKFKKHAVQLLVATDVAARGIDVNDLTHVMHHTLPDHLENYTHRSGRTARIGKKGISLVFINNREGRRITELERKSHITFEKIEVPDTDKLKTQRLDTWAQGLAETRVDAQAEDVLMALQSRFSDLSKEDILKRLITEQLEKLDGLSKDRGELNQKRRDSGRGEENRNAQKRGGDNKDFNRYFINLGTMDGMSKLDLICFLSDVSGVKRKFFGQMTLKSNCAYFDVDSRKDKGLPDRFKGLEIEGRELRVNRDDEGAPRSERRDKKKFRNDQKGNKKRFNKGDKR